MVQQSPQISVVMSVYNGAAYLRESMDSVLAQTGVDFELIVVNDGSTDSSGAILREYAAADSRVKVIHQENAGLTKALIRGCAEARGVYIARQDADDVSLPSRLHLQHLFLESHPEVAFVSCSTEFVGPGGELMYTVTGPECAAEATERLKTNEVQQLKGPNGHGSVMFRTASYRSVGGYRSQFRYAQDLDLWTRLAETGLLAVLPNVLYQVRFSENCISMNRADSQRAAAALIVECSRRRRLGLDEAPILEQVKRLSDSCGNSTRKPTNGSYFIGNCLRARKDQRAVGYLWSAIKANPLHFRAWYSLIRSAPLAIQNRIRKACQSFRRPLTCA